MANSIYRRSKQVKIDVFSRLHCWRIFLFFVAECLIYVLKILYQFYPNFTFHLLLVFTFRRWTFYRPFIRDKGRLLFEFEKYSFKSVHSIVSQRNT